MTLMLALGLCHDLQAGYQVWIRPRPGAPSGTLAVFASGEPLADLAAGARMALRG